MLAGADKYQWWNESPLYCLYEATRQLTIQHSNLTNSFHSSYTGLTDIQVHRYLPSSNSHGKKPKEAKYLLRNSRGMMRYNCGGKLNISTVPNHASLYDVECERELAHRGRGKSKVIPCVSEFIAENRTRNPSQIFQLLI
jgi:hypothetical protein